jgi:hypothetical protein
MAFLEECINWVGGSFYSLIPDGLNKIQAKRLEDYSKANPTPTKSLKKKTEGQASDQNGGQKKGIVKEEEEEPDFSAMDAYDLATPVDMLKTYGETFFEGVIALEKWDQKRAKLDEFLAKANKTPRFAQGNYFFLSNTVKRLFMEANVQVQVISL